MSCELCTRVSVLILFFFFKKKKNECFESACVRVHVMCVCFYFVFVCCFCFFFLISDQAKLPLDKLVDTGFIFIWVPAAIIYYVTTVLESKSFRFADSATFVRKDLNNRIVSEPRRFFNTSKLTCLIFRKSSTALNIEDYRQFNPEKGIFETDYDFDKKDFKHVDMKHQRTADVHFGFVKHHHEYKKLELKCDKDYLYPLIERLLPLSTEHISDAIERNASEKEMKELKSKLLYLWAPRYEIRRGWTMVVDMKHCAYLKQLEREEEEAEANKKSWD